MTLVLLLLIFVAMLAYRRDILWRRILARGAFLYGMALVLGMVPAPF